MIFTPFVTPLSLSIRDSEIFPRPQLCERTKRPLTRLAPPPASDKKAQNTLFLPFGLASVKIRM
jgi:hypothetical protein